MKKLNPYEWSRFHALRVAHPELTQRIFATRFGISIETVKRPGWEHSQGFTDPAPNAACALALHPSTPTLTSP